MIGDACLLRGDQRLDGGEDVSSCQEVGFDFVDIDLDARLFRGDPAVNDWAVWHLAETHGDEIGESDVCPGEPCAQPDAEEGEDDGENDESDDSEDDEADCFWIHDVGSVFGSYDELEGVCVDDFEIGARLDVSGLGKRLEAFPVYGHIPAG